MAVLQGIGDAAKLGDLRQRIFFVLGALLNRMIAALWIIAVLANLTAIQRVVFTLLTLRRRAQGARDVR